MMQPRYFLILALFTVSLLTSCAHKTQHANNPTVPVKDTESQPQQNVQESKIPDFPTTPLQPMANQPQQNAQGVKIPEFPTTPPQQMGSQPQQNVQESKTSEVPNESSAYLALHPKQAQQMGLTTKSAPVAVKPKDQVQASQQNQTEQKQSPPQKLINDQISTDMAEIDAAISPTKANSGLRLSLEEAFQRAEARNPQLLAALRNLNISYAGITIAGARPNPQVSAQFGVGNIYTVSSNPQQFGISQTLELAGKRSKRISVAKSQYDLALLQYNSTRFDLHGQVRRAYAELAAAQASARSQQEQIQLLQKLVYIARKRFEAGAAPEAELLQAQLALNQTEPQLRQALERIEQARIQFNGVLGDNPTQNVQISDPGIFALKVVKTVKKTELVPAPNTQLPTLNELLARAYKERLDLKIAQQQTAVAQQQLRLASAQRVPDPQLSSGYLFTTANAPGVENTTGVFFGVAVNLPIFYKQQGELAQAQATIDQSQQQEKAVQLQIAVDVHAAYQALLIARETISKYQFQLLPASREVLGLAQESYQVGKTNLASVITVEQADQQNRSAYVDAITAYQSSYADLEKAIGTSVSF